MSNEYLSTLTAELAQHGVATWVVDTQHKHPRLLFHWRGKDLMYVFPGTPSDARGALNAISNLRQLMGVQRIIHKSTRPPKRRTKIAAFIEMPTITVGEDPMAALVAARYEAERRIQTARHHGQRAFLSGQCGSAPSGIAPHLARAFIEGWWSAVRVFAS